LVIFTRYREHSHLEISGPGQGSFTKNELRSEKGRQIFDPGERDSLKRKYYIPPERCVNFFVDLKISGDPQTLASALT